MTGSLSCVFAATLAMTTLLLQGCDNQPEKPYAPPIQPVKVLVITDNDSGSQRVMPATVRASQRADLAFQVSGKMIERPAFESKQFKQGELLARLDDADFRSDLNAARARVQDAKGNFARAEELLKKKFISQADYDKLKATYDVAVSDYQKAGTALEYTRLTAPFDGVVVRVYVENFQEVQAKQKILSLQNVTDLELLVDVPENLILKYRSRDQIGLAARFDGIPDKQFPLSIKKYSSEASKSTRTFQYVLGIDDTMGERILPGMTAKVVVTTQAPEQENSAHVIPLSALAAGPGGSKQVWLLDSSDRVQPQAVETGDLTGNASILVTSGLEPGDRLVVAGVAALQRGMQVKPVTQISY